jgi:hypothetical protein
MAATSEPIDSQQGQDPLKDRPQAEQHHEQFEKISQTAIGDELLNGPEADCADDANHKNPD